MAKYKVSHSGFALFTVISLAIVLVLCGIFFGAVLFSEFYSRQIKEEIRLIAELNPDAKVDDPADMIDEIAGIAGVNGKSVVFVSAEDALAEISSGFEASSLEAELENPFEDMIQFSLEASYVNRDSIEVIRQTILSGLPVREVLYPSTALDDLFGVIRKARYYVLLFMCIALVLAGILIHHLMRLNVLSQRKQIRTMELVGANPAFIRRPFLRLGLRMGFRAWLFSIAFALFLSVVVLGIGPTVSWLFSIPGLLGWAFLLVLSVGLSWFSTRLAVNQSIGQTFGKYT